MALTAEAILAELNTHGWCQGHAFADDGSVCLMGAAVLAGANPDSAWQVEPVWAALENVIRGQFPERWLPDMFSPHPVTAVYRFNDHPDTTRADVDLILEKVIASEL